jgi:hypothetical protein
LGDRRLSQRLVILASQLAADPAASIPKACGPWGQSKAAYRFLDNHNVDESHLLAPRPFTMITTPPHLWVMMSPRGEGRGRVRGKEEKSFGNEYIFFSMPLPRLNQVLTGLGITS